MLLTWQFVLSIKPITFQDARNGLASKFQKSELRLWQILHRLSVMETIRIMMQDHVTLGQAAGRPAVWTSSSCNASCGYFLTNELLIALNSSSFVDLCYRRLSPSCTGFLGLTNAFSGCCWLATSWQALFRWLQYGSRSGIQKEDS